jgi:hypothetical protein
VRIVVAVGLSAGVIAAGCASTPRLGDFRSDGCSLFPDGNYYGCCWVHDVAYWPGGTAAQRERADEALRTCVQDATGSAPLAQLVFHGVRVGGGPELPTTYRWGFGWPYPHRKDYAPLTPDEQGQVADKTARLCAAIRPNPATGGYAVDAGKEISAVQARQVCPGL